MLALCIVIMGMEHGPNAQRTVMVARSPGRLTSGFALHMVAGHAHLAKAGTATLTNVRALAKRRLGTTTEVETPFTSIGTMLIATIRKCQGGSSPGTVGTGTSSSATHVAIPQRMTVLVSGGTLTTTTTVMVSLFTSTATMLDALITRGWLRGSCSEGVGAAAGVRAVGPLGSNSGAAISVHHRVVTAIPRTLTLMAGATPCIWIDTIYSVRATPEQVNFQR